MFSRRSFVLSLSAACSIGAASRVFAEQPRFFTRNGAVIGGYDVVAYFTEGKPVMGDSAHSVMWQGGTWLFSTAQNRERFEMNPRAYAPQYGGYCAYAVARGYTAKVEPEAWRVVDDKLYLNYSRAVRALWAANIPGNIANGDENWPAVLKK